MKPVSLKADPSYNLPVSPSELPGPTVYLDTLPVDLDIPEEGEIRFRYSRRRRILTDAKSDARQSVELCLKTITDICDCKGKDEENNDGKKEAKDADEVFDALIIELKDEDYVDESEDDNPDKY